MNLYIGYYFFTISIILLRTAAAARSASVNHPGHLPSQRIPPLCLKFIHNCLNLQVSSQASAAIMTPADKV